MNDSPLWSRREVLRLLGAGGAMSACHGPVEKILPYVRQPEGVLPGKPTHYATAMTLRGYATGVLAESHEGRPTRLDGNPDHPASLGATGIVEQASILDLYDPDRARLVTLLGQPASFSAFVAENLPGRRRGAVRVLLPPQSSPLLAAGLARVPGARACFWDPLETSGPGDAARAVLGKDLVARRSFDRAGVVACFDGDFLDEATPFHLRHARQFASRRRPPGEMSRLWAVEGDLSLAGAIADRRLRARPSAIGAHLAALLAEVLVRLGDRAPPALRSLDAPAARAGVVTGRARAFLGELAGDLLAAPGAGLVLVGERQPPESHAIALALEAALGHPGSTVEYAPPARLEGGLALSELIAEMQGGEVDTLVVADLDPVRDVPPPLPFAEALSRVRNTVVVGLHASETSAQARWFVPGLHYLESWGDGRAFDGTLSIVQPLIAPLYGGRCLGDVLAVLAGDADPSAHDRLRRLHALPDREWEEALRRGLLPGTELAPERPALDPAPVLAALEAIAARAPVHEIEAALRPDRKILDGRFAHNAWLVELPDPVTHLSWGGAAEMSPATARSLGLSDGDVARIERAGRQVSFPVLRTEGLADDVVILPLGWGRPGPGGDPVGQAAEPLRTAQEPWLLGPVTVARAFGTDPLGDPRALGERLARTQRETDLHDRKSILETLELTAYREAPFQLASMNAPTPSLYEPWPKEGSQWGMNIDLGVCNGCSACVVACQAENNVPVVGAEGIRKGREMYWLRIDRYRLGRDEDDIQLLPQPMLCQHCERAPCEYVCPVNATVHSPDGLNEMVYNRCIGTRFCSNNCPYKVRRFNYFEYNDGSEAETLKMQHNPEVTVRARGVMEKCSYCVQRIRAAEIESRVRHQPIRDGEVHTACQDACPTGAIVFGLVSDPESKVSERMREPRCYAALHQQGTEPRTRYLAHVRNAGGPA